MRLEGCRREKHRAAGMVVLILCVSGHLAIWYTKSLTFVTVYKIYSTSLSRLTSEYSRLARQKKNSRDFVQNCVSGIKEEM